MWRLRVSFRGHDSVGPSPCFWSKSLTGLELTKWARLDGQPAPDNSLSQLRLWFCKSTWPCSKFYFMWVLEIKLRLACLQGKHFNPVGYSPSPHLWVFPLKNLSFQVHWPLLILNGVLSKSMYSHDKHKYPVGIRCRWGQCSLSQSRLCSDAGATTRAPCVTCFYEWTFIGIQQPSLYCRSICCYANPSWVQ